MYAATVNKEKAPNSRMAGHEIHSSAVLQLFTKRDSTNSIMDFNHTTDCFIVWPNFLFLFVYKPFIRMSPTHTSRP